MTLLAQHDIDAKKRGEDWSFQRAARSIAVLAGRSHDARARQFLDDVRSRCDHDVDEYIADAIVCLHELPTLRDVSWIAYTKSLAHGAPERVVMLVLQVDDQVCNGGFTQFFLNSSGDDWRETLSALETVGATESARLAREAVRLLGGERYVATERSRAKAIGDLSEARSTAIDEITSQYDSKSEYLFVRTAEWLVSNRGSIPADRRRLLAKIPR